METKNKIKYLFLFLMLTILLGSCEDDETVSGPPSFSKITTIADMETPISEGSMGTWISIQGENLEGTTSIRFNDVEVDMDEVYYENEKLYLAIPVKLPLEVTNKAFVTTPEGEIAFDFTVIAPEFQLTGMFNEYTVPGDTIRIYGKFFELYEVNSETTVVDFGNAQQPVIKATDTYLTAKVPANVASNIKLKVINNKYGVEASCPGYYQDKNHVITTFDTDFPYTGPHQEWVGEWDNKKPGSGKYLKFQVDQATYPNGLGWFYLMETGFNYEQDMLTNPQNYQLKFELKMSVPIKTTAFYIYYYWAVAPVALSGETFAVQTLGQWQSVTIPLEKIVMNYPGSGTSYSLNIRVESFAPVETVGMYFDNFRIYKKGE